MDQFKKKKRGKNKQKKEKKLKEGDTRPLDHIVCIPS